jgi:hypothetical protein
MMELSIICRKKLDEQYGNPQICECPMCREERKNNLLNLGKGKDKEQAKISSPSSYCEASQEQ